MMPHHSIPHIVPQPLEEYLADLDARADAVKNLPPAGTPPSGVFKAYENSFYREQALEAQVNEWKFMAGLLGGIVVILTAALVWLASVINAMLNGGARW